MQRLELVEEILDYMRELYKADYIGLIRVEQNDTEYKFTLGVPCYMIPTVIITTAESDEDFLDFIHEELRTRNYMKIDKYQVIRTTNTREE